MPRGEPCLEGAVVCPRPRKPGILLSLGARIVRFSAHHAPPCRQFTRIVRLGSKPDAPSRRVHEPQPFDPVTRDNASKADAASAMKSATQPEVLGRAAAGRQPDDEARMQAAAWSRVLFDGAREGMLLADAHTRRIQFANPAVGRMLGYPPDELSQYGLEDLHPAATRDHVRAELDALMQGGKSAAEVQYLRQDGGLVVASITLSVLELGGCKLLQVFVVDLTVSQQAAQAEHTLRQWNQTLEHRVGERTVALKQSEGRFRQLADATFEGIAVTAGGVLVDGNAQLGVIHGYPMDEMIGRPVANFIAPESRQLVAQCIRDGDEIPYEYVAAGKDGTLFPAEVRGRMSVWGGQPMRISAIRDLSLVKQDAARFRAQQTELDHALRLSLVSEICAGIIHQIGQPLSAIGVYAAAIADRLLTCQLQSCGNVTLITKLEDAVAFTRDTVTHLRTLIQPELGFTHVPVDINDWVTRVLRLLRVEAETRGVVLEVSLGRDLPRVMANATQLNQVILILARNAFDACAACPPARRGVAITTRAIRGDQVELSVRDAGTGIAPEAMSQLFAPFFSTKADGTGIGLRLSRTIVQAHGGDITGRNNQDGCGATFRVILPGQSAAAATFYTKE